MTGSMVLNISPSIASPPKQTNPQREATSNSKSASKEVIEWRRSVQDELDEAFEWDPTPKVASTAANVPRGKMECGLCNLPVEGIGGPGAISFAQPSRTSGMKTPENKGRGGTKASPFTPFTTYSGSCRASFSSPFTNTIHPGLPAPPPLFPIRIDNIPWDISSAELLAFLCLPPTAGTCFVHIIADRKTCQTFSQCYVDFPSLELAQGCVFRLDGKKIVGNKDRYVKAGSEGRPVSVSLCGTKEVMEELFYSFKRGFGEDVLSNVDEEDIFLTGQRHEVIRRRELENLVMFCGLQVRTPLFPS
ncbi:hypothetical protein BT69DRAFT_1294433 [Atractiella rhizophila]|nr:hypothetical protein BT69DRAFT_1294433 [Atractiella rhizophila]